MISFDSNNLQSAYLLVNKLNKSDSASRDIQSEILSFQDGFNVVSNFWRSRTITIGGTIDATGSQHLADTLDTLKQNLSGVNKNLDIDYGTGTRRYKGTLSRFSAPEEFYNITYLPYTVEFLCQPFGYSTSSINLSSNDVTAASHTEAFTFSGTYKPQPIITLTATDVSAVTAISINNTTTGDVITITTAIADNDVISINTETHKVTKNGTQINFTGPIPSFDTGSNSLTITFTGTSLTYDIDISYTARYL